MSTFKFVIEKHAEGFVAYPLGMNGVVVGEGDTFAQALEDARSAAQFHLHTFGPDALVDQDDVLEAFIAEGALDR